MDYFRVCYRRICQYWILFVFPRSEVGLFSDRELGSKIRLQCIEIIWWNNVYNESNNGLFISRLLIWSKNRTLPKKINVENYPKLFQVELAQHNRRHKLWHPILQLPNYKIPRISMRLWNKKRMENGDYDRLSLLTRWKHKIKFNLK